MAIQLSYTSSEIETILGQVGTAVQGSALPGLALVLKSADATEIPADSDLDDYTAPGAYKVMTAANAQSMDNCPSTVAGRLIVMQEYKAASVLQVYIAGVSYRPKIYIRHETSADSWTAWAEIITTGDDTYQAITSALADEGDSWED